MKLLAGWFPLYDLEPGADIDSDPNIEGALLFEPREDYDSAIIGYTKLVSGETVVVYSYDSLRKILYESWDDIEDEEGERITMVDDHLHVNMIGSYVGSRTPFIVIEDVTAGVDADEAAEDLVQNLWGREIAR